MSVTKIIGSVAGVVYGAFKVFMSPSYRWLKKIKMSHSYLFPQLAIANVGPLNYRVEFW